MASVCKQCGKAYNLPPEPKKDADLADIGKYIGMCMKDHTSECQEITRKTMIVGLSPNGVLLFETAYRLGLLS